MNYEALYAWMRSLFAEQRARGKRERGFWALREEWVIPIDVAPVSEEASVAVALFLGDARVVWRTQRTLDGFLSLWRSIARQRERAR